MLDSRTRRRTGAALLALVAAEVRRCCRPGRRRRIPFGPPLTAHLVSDDRRPTLAWHGAEDDWIALGEALGVFAEPDPGRTGAEVLTDSEEVQTYPRRDGAPAPG